MLVPAVFSSTLKDNTISGIFLTVPRLNVVLLTIWQDSSVLCCCVYLVLMRQTDTNTRNLLYAISNGVIYDDHKNPTGSELDCFWLEKLNKFKKPGSFTIISSDPRKNSCYQILWLLKFSTTTGSVSGLLFVQINRGAPNHWHLEV